jgi:DNA polymerase
MSIITIDFETYYDKEYSLSKMTTEEYINDPRFEVIGVGVKVDDQESVWYSGKDVAYVLKNLDWSDHAVLCHNTLFDGAILAWKYGVKPGFWMDTMSMARAMNDPLQSVSLAALAKLYKVGEKGDEVINALGKRLVDFDPVSIERYGAYCRNDVDLTYGLFQRLAEGFPDSELKLIDLTLRMFTEPTLQVDDALLVKRLEEVRASKKDLLGSLIVSTESIDEEEVRYKLSSNSKFADILRSFGVEPPTKISPSTGKTTYALAKTDQGFIDLKEHDDPVVQHLCAVRLGTKSTLEESRIERFIGIGSRNYGHLPVPLRYYGAHTGRWSGLDSVNFQNLPSRDKKKKTLKNGIVAPDGHVIINCDSSQIEARVLAWLACQDDLVQRFANKRDVYSEFATEVFGRPITKANEMERFVGKTCILGLGYGTGAAKLQATLKQGGADLTLDECKRIVTLYRGLNYRIPELWGECDAALRKLIIGTGVNSRLGRTNSNKINAVWVDPDVGIQLPNGMYIRYPKLRLDEAGKYSYESRRGTVNIWGGAVVENVVQALARIVVGEQMIWISEHYRPVLTVHDAVVLVVPKNELEDALEYVNLCMSTAPAWAEGLPVACEAKWGKSYGEC